MTGSTDGSGGIPPPLDDDDGDVAWALTTAQVQWSRGAYADAVVWLRRAVDSAIEVGHKERATELNGIASALTERMLSQAASSPQAAPEPGVAAGADVDDLLDAVPESASPEGASPRPSGSFDVSFDSVSDQPEQSDTTMLTDYAPDDVAAAQAAADAAELAARNVAVVPSSGEPNVPVEPPASVDIRSNPFLQSDDVIASGDIHSVQSEEMITSGDVHSVQSGDVLSSSDVESVDSGAFAQSFDSDDMESEPTIPTSEPVPPEAVPPPPVAPPVAPPPPPSAAKGPPGPPPRPEPPPVDVAPDPPPPQVEAPGEVELPTEPPPPDVEAPGEAGPPADEPPPAAGAMIRDVPLEDVLGLQDLPEEAQAMLVEKAKFDTINLEEEVGNFEVALVVGGWVNVMPAIDEIAAVVVQVGEVVFTTGTVDQGVELRVVAGEDGTVVATWDRATFEEAVADCPWVADELRTVADRYQALAGATMGPLGERLDDSLRATVLDKLQVRALGPGEVLVEVGKEIRELQIVGAGHIEVVEGEGDDAKVTSDLGLGDFVFPERVLDHGKATLTARAGEHGALVLVGDGMSTQELVTSVPPLLEILAGA